ncbi:ArsR family transcriptional regulator [Victivallis vadensis]|uniref:ArsR family transcriptional regulator n=1 Tax=Victivallis vadensis TaxID=172901 RepID=A0A848B425_9BACT|nr:ArsR family transcriptional regulator [Victivallis vadensis]
MLQFLQSHPGWRVPNLAEALQKSRPTIERHLRELRNTGKIEFRGAPKNGGYFSK